MGVPLAEADARQARRDRRDLHKRRALRKPHAPLRPHVLLRLHDLRRLRERLSQHALRRPRVPHPSPARQDTWLHPIMPTILRSQGMNTPVRRRTTMRPRTVLAATISPAMRTTGRVRPFRCGVRVRSMRGYGLRRNG